MKNEEKIDWEEKSARLNHFRTVSKDLTVIYGVLKDKENRAGQKSKSYDGPINNLDNVKRIEIIQNLFSDQMKSS